MGLFISLVSLSYCGTDATCWVRQSSESAAWRRGFGDLQGSCGGHCTAALHLRCSRRSKRVLGRGWRHAINAWHVSLAEQCSRSGQALFS
jgi:hypothetical protein